MILQFVSATVLFELKNFSPYIQIRLQENMYSIFLEDLLRIVPKEQIHAISFENYINNTAVEIERLHRFLGLRKCCRNLIEMPLPN